MRTRIKVCGITTFSDAKRTIEAGVDALGFVMSKSPRRVSMETAHKIICGLPPMTTTIGVFVDESPAFVKEALRRCRFSAIQLQGSESIDDFEDIEVPIIKSYKIKDTQEMVKLESDERVSAYLFDKYDKNRAGGTGESFDWSLLSNKAMSKPFVLAGGLSNKNVADAIRLLRPYAVDVSSGVEKKPGTKDESLIKSFVKQVMIADSDI